MERRDRSTEPQDTGFAPRLLEPLVREIRASERHPGVTRGKASAQPPGDDNSQNAATGTGNEAGRNGSFYSDERNSPTFSEELIGQAISRFSAYMREERERYRPQARPLTQWECALFGRFFSPELLLQARVLALSGCRMSNPTFYEEARTLGVTNLPDLTQGLRHVFRCDGLQRADYRPQDVPCLGACRPGARSWTTVLCRTVRQGRAARAILFPCADAGPSLCIGCKICRGSGTCIFRRG